MNTMTKLLIIASFVAICCIVALLVLGPPLGEAKIERINRHLTALRDRAARNPSDTNALDMLIECLHSRNPFERNAAIALVGQLGPRAKPAVRGLIGALNGSDPYDAREAARSLGEIGVAAREAVPALSRAVKNVPDADVGWFAADSLGAIADPDDAGVVAILQDAKKSRDPRMAEHASRSLSVLDQRRMKRPSE